MIFSGSSVALVTPFKDGCIDYEALKGLIDFHVQSGTFSLVICGTTGESATLSYEEHYNLVKFAVDFSDSRILIIAGTGSNSTVESIKLSQEAQKAGVDAVLSIVPYYNKPTQLGLTSHFSKIAQEIDIPLILYNVPSRVGVSLEVDTVLSLASSFSNIVGIKEASGRVEIGARIIHQVRKIRDDFFVLSGDDLLTLPLMLLGATGVISTVANIVPKEMAHLCRFCVQEDYKNAIRMYHKIYDLISVLFIESNPIPLKFAMGLLGKCLSDVRSPLSPPSLENQAKIKQTLIQLGLMS